MQQHGVLQVQCKAKWTQHHTNCPLKWKQKQMESVTPFASHTWEIPQTKRNTVRVTHMRDPADKKGTQFASHTWEIPRFFRNTSDTDVGLFDPYVSHKLLLVAWRPLEGSSHSCRAWKVTVDTLRNVNARDTTAYSKCPSRCRQERSHAPDSPPAQITPCKLSAWEDCTLNFRWIRSKVLLWTVNGAARHADSGDTGEQTSETFVCEPDASQNTSISLSCDP